MATTLNSKTENVQMSNTKPRIDGCMTKLRRDLQVAANRWNERPRKGVQQ